MAEMTEAGRNGDHGSSNRGKALLAQDCIVSMCDSRKPAVVDNLTLRSADSIHIRNQTPHTGANCRFCCNLELGPRPGAS